MKFVCNSNELQKSIGIVEKAVSQRTSLPILENLFFQVKDNKLTLRGNDLEIGIENIIDLKTVEAEGSILIKAKTISSIVSRLQNQDLEIEVDEKNKMIRRYNFLSIVAIALVLVVPLSHPALGASVRTPFAAPEFTHQGENDWINSPPLILRNFRGKVMLIDFWTFDCWNCYRSFPWLNKMEKRLSDQNFQIIGVHSPEFSHEKIRSSIEAKVQEFGLHHPIMIDNDFSYWRAMYNKYWPAFYIVDKKGQVRGIYYGETHEGDIQAKHIEETINSLLLENP